jgi:hypothetical protein
VVAEHGEDLIIEIRTSDGFVNATKMCVSRGMRLEKYKDSKSGIIFLKKCKESNPTLTEIMVSRGRVGTWVHHEVAIDIATWINPAFRVAVTDVMTQYNSRNALIADIPTNNTTVLLVAYHNGKIITELCMSDGFVNATMLCTSAGKNLGNYFHRNSYKELLKELLKEVKVPVVSSKGRRSCNTYVHSRIAIDIAICISSEYVSTIKPHKSFEYFFLNRSNMI